MKRTPSLFVSHGSPMFAVTPGLLGPNLRALGDSLQNVRAILVVSPHWQTRGFKVTAAEQLETIHDFVGFPAELYQLQYSPKGSPSLAADVVELLRSQGFDVSLDADRGIDHGAWVPLMHMLPSSELPVLQLSMPMTLSAADALALGEALAPLRDQGVMIVGSGSLTHNLYEFRQHISDPEYAQDFAEWANDAVMSRDVDSLLNYRTKSKYGARAHPTQEHYLPLLVALGASSSDDVARLVEGGMTDGILSMDSFVWEAA